MRFNHNIIFFKLADSYKISDIYINHNNCLGHMLIIESIYSILFNIIYKHIYKVCYNKMKL